MEDLCDNLRESIAGMVPRDAEYSTIAIQTEAITPNLCDKQCQTEILNENRNDN